jgi:hypothetical protein
MNGIMDKLQLVKTRPAGFHTVPMIECLESTQHLPNRDQSMRGFRMLFSWIVEEVSIVQQISKPVGRAILSR